MKYNSIDEFLVDHDSSLDDFLSEIKKSSNTNTYQEYTELLSHKLLDTHLVAGTGIHIPGLFDMALVWTDTTKGQRFWENIHDSWLTYTFDNKVESIHTRNNLYIIDDKILDTLGAGAGITPSLSLIEEILK